MGATHGSSLAKLRSAPPAALAACPRAPRAPSLVAPATIVAAPAATVTAAVASTPEMPALAAPSSLDAFFFFGAIGSFGAEDASFDAPQPISSATVGVPTKSSRHERTKGASANLGRSGVHRPRARNSTIFRQLCS